MVALLSMIRKGVNRFSNKIMLRQNLARDGDFNLIPSRSRLSGSQRPDRRLQRRP